MISKVQSGQRYGALTVIGFSERRRGHVYWKTMCECGKPKEVSTTNLLNGSVSSCGCVTSLIRSARKTTHGMTKTTEYKSWLCMKERCSNKSNPEFSSYGGRGITVCENWTDSFERFFDDMGEKPSPSHSIDRINVNGNYEPSNCRWATMREQLNNKQNTLFLTIDGETKCFTDWLPACKAGRVLTWIRIFRLGWSHKDAVFTEPKTRRLSLRGQPVSHGGKLA
jgi:hypothetical protein